jgi:hypothetical protein
MHGGIEVRKKCLTTFVDSESTMTHGSDFNDHRRINMHIRVVEKEGAPCCFGEEERRTM